MQPIAWIDAQQMHREHPLTFWAPSAEQLDAIAPGNSVKVAADGERFWVSVTSRDGDVITGTVDNDLVCPEHGLRYGDAVTLETRHVYDIL